MATTTARTEKITEIRTAENCMFWLDRLTMFQILSFSDNPRNGFLNFALAACLLVFTHYNYVKLCIERRRIGHPYSDEANAEFNRLAFYEERVGFIVMILWLAFGWAFAFEITLLLITYINGIYMQQYVKQREENYAHIRAATTQESEKTEANDVTTQESEKIQANAAGIEENKQSEPDNKVQEGDEDDKGEELKTSEDSKQLFSTKEIDLSRRLGQAKLRIKELQDQCHNHNKEKKDLTTSLNRVTKSLYEFSNDITRLIEENRDLVTKLSETSSWYQFQVLTTLDYENRNTFLEEENKILQDNLNEMKSSYKLFDEVKLSFEFYKSCYEDMEEEYMKLMEEKIELSATFAAKTECSDKAFVELEEKCRILKEENLEAHSQIFVAEEKCRRMEDEKIEIMRQISAAEEKCRRFEQDKTDLMSELSTAKASAEIYQSYLHDLDDYDLVVVD